MISNQHKEPSELYSKITAGSLTGMMHSGTMLVIGLMLPPIILHFLDGSGYGRWVFLIAIATYLNLCELGLTTGLTRLWSNSCNINKFSEPVKVFRTVFLMYVTVGFIGVLFGAASTKWRPDSLALLPYFIIGVTLKLMGEPFSGVLQGRQRTDLVNITNTLTVILYAVLIYAGLNAGLGLLSIALALIVSNIIRLFTLFYQIRRCSLIFNPIWGPMGSIRPIFKLGMNDQITRIWTVAVSPTNRIILFGILGSSALTAYELGARIVASTALLPAVILPALLPAFSYFQSINDGASVRDIISRANKYINVIGLPFFWFIIIFADPLIAAWLSRPSPDVALGARILMIGAYINLFSGPIVQALLGCGKPGLCIRKAVIGCILGFVLPVGLAFTAGFVGFLIGESLAAAIPAIIFLISFQRQEGQKIVSEMSSMFSKVSVIITPFLGLLYITYSVSIGSKVWQLFWVWAIVFTVYYFTLIIIFKIFGVISTREYNKVKSLILLKGY